MRRAAAPGSRSPRRRAISPRGRSPPTLSTRLNRTGGAFTLVCTVEHSTAVRRYTNARPNAESVGAAPLAAVLQHVVLGRCAMLQHVVLGSCAMLCCNMLNWAAAPCYVATCCTRQLRHVMLQHAVCGRRSPPTGLGASAGSAGMKSATLICTTRDRLALDRTIADRCCGQRRLSVHAAVGAVSDEWQAVCDSCAVSNACGCNACCLGTAQHSTAQHSTAQHSTAPTRRTYGVNSAQLGSARLSSAVAQRVAAGGGQ